MKLSLNQKVELLDGLDVWHTKSFDGIAEVMMADGPHGLRKQVDVTDHLGINGSVKATAFPPACLLACSFDRELVKKVSKAIAIEAKANHVQMVLGPGINIKRSPLCGRNFEYFSEDPFLAGELAASYVSEMEKNGVGTSVKHFFCNNQEKYRFFIDSIVDERTLREIYLKAFERVIKEKPASVMASYNKINGYYATESPVIQKILRGEWNYKGIVVSDWGAISNRTKSIKAGCDLEMPSSHGFRTKQVLKDIEKDLDLMDAVDKSAQRMIDFANRYQQKDEVKCDLDKHHQSAIEVASQSMVLLKNDKILPLKKEDKVLLISEFAENIRYQGGGSSHVNPYKVDQIKDIYQKYSDYLDIETSINASTFEKISTYDKVIAIIGLPDSMETEGFDRTHLNLPESQYQMIEKLAEINPNIIVVVLTGSVVNLSFEPKVKGLLIAYLGGQGSASAILNILYGITNPSGRLAETWIDDISDCNVQLTSDNQSIHYSESIYVGYRYYNTFNQKVHYPFGYGLSYSKFIYEKVQIERNGNSFIISFDLVNHGPYDGSEVIQVYTKNNGSSLHQANRELKQFDKVHLMKDEKRHIELVLELDALKIYDVKSKAFVLEQGSYQIELAKDVEKVIFSQEVFLEGQILENQNLSYQESKYDTSDFEKLYGRPLPLKHIKKKRPYTLDSTIEDTSQTFLGRVIGKQILKKGLEELGDLNDGWMQEVAKKTILETPFKMLALFSDGKVSFEFIEGIIDIINLNWIKGMKKIKKSAKENKRT